MIEQQLPEGWQMVKFGDIAKHISKRVEPSETDLEIYVGLEHLDPDSLKIKRHGVPSDVEGQKLLVKKGQIIFGKRRAYQRKVAVADWDCICSAHAMVLEANPDKVIPGFLPFFMQSDAFMNRAVVISEGSLSPTIKWKVLAEQKFPFPTKNIQEKLLHLLIKTESSLNEAVAAIAQSKKFKSSMLFKLFSENVFSFPVEHKKLAEICTFIGRGATPTYCDTDTSYVTINQKCIRDGEVSILDSRFHEPTKKIKNMSLLKDGDILINSTGTGTLGRAGLWIAPDDKTYFIDTHITRLSLGKNIKLSRSLVEYLNTPYFQRQLYSECVTGSTNQIELNKSQLCDVRVPIFADSHLEIVNRILGEINSVLHSLSQKMESIFSIKRSILNKYWS
jgi:restriction endonuclease S subunit